MSKYYLEGFKDSFKYSKWVLFGFALNLFCIFLMVWCCMQCGGPSDPLVVIKDTDSDIDVDVEFNILDFD